MADSAPEKKKRRQNVACDSCRLRRVKCDMLTLLTVNADPARPTPPLHVLVREQPDVSCSNCIGKGIRCTTNQIVNPSKPNKGGRRIEEAKRKYGSDGAEIIGGRTPSPTGPGGGGAAGPGPVVASASGSGSGNGLAPPPMHSGSSTTPTYPPTPLPHMNFQLPLLDPSAMDGAPMLNPLGGGTTIGGFIGGPSPGFMPFHGGYDFATPAPLLPLVPPPATHSGQSHSNVNVNDTWASSTQFSFDTMGTDMHFSSDGFQAAWDALVIPPPGGSSSSASANAAAAPHLVHVAPPPVAPEPVSPGDGAGLSPSPPAQYPLIDMEYTFDPRTDSMVPRSGSATPGPSSLTTAMSSRPSSRFSDPTLASDDEPLAGGNNMTNADRYRLYQESFTSPLDTALVSRKRTREEDDSDGGVIEVDRNGDPYALWAPSERTVRWGQREMVAERLADRALGRELSRHLVRVYFQAVHLTMPAISPEAFYMDWQRAGERSDRMTPAQETLCAVMEAWAARFSDNPVILGLDKSKANSAPRVITEEGQFLVGTAARAHWGRARLPVCQALLARARKLIDMHGLLRVPSVTGVQALSLYSQLQHMSDTQDNLLETEMENEMIHASIINQMQRLGMGWSSDSFHKPTSSTELQTGRTPMPHDAAAFSVAQERIKQRRLFWTIVVADAFWAAGSGAEPKVPDEDVETSGAWLLNIDETLGPSTFKALSFFMNVYHQAAVLGRSIARKLSVPARRPGSIDVRDFCNRVRGYWREIRDLYRNLNVRSEEYLSMCEHEVLGFSPIHHLSSLRSSCCFLLLILHQQVDEQLKFRKTLKGAYVRSDSSPDSAPQADHLQLLEDLHFQSVDSTLTIARATVPLLSTLHPMGVMQGAAMMLRCCLATTQFLAEIPTNEQGYPSTTTGGNGWTWDVKQQEVQVCVESLYQMGWAWADVAEVIDRVMVTMERLHPTAAEFATFAEASKPASFGQVAAQRQRELDRDTNAVDAALRLWPPLSVPTVVGAWSRNAILESPNGSFERSETTPRLEARAMQRVIDSYGAKERLEAANGTMNGTLPLRTSAAAATAAAAATVSTVPTDSMSMSSGSVGTTPASDDGTTDYTKGRARPLGMTPAMMWALERPALDHVAATEVAARRIQRSQVSRSTTPSLPAIVPRAADESSGGVSVGMGVGVGVGVGMALGAEIESFLESLVSSE